MRPDFERFLRPDWERYVTPAGRERRLRELAEYKAAFEPWQVRRLREQNEVHEREEEAALERKLAEFRRERLERERAWEAECAARKATADAAWERFMATLARYLEQQRVARKYSPDQPRVPAGNPDGGQWTSEGGTQGGEDRLEQSLAPAPNQPPRSDLAELEAISNDPNVRSRIEEAWKASNPYSFFQREQGFWISRHAETGELYTRPFAGPALRNAIAPGPVPNDAIAFFHTHPIRGARSEPGALDLIFAGKVGLPGLLQSHNGMHYFGPALRPPKPR